MWWVETCHEWDPTWIALRGLIKSPIGYTVQTANHGLTNRLSQRWPPAGCPYELWNDHPNYSQNEQISARYARIWNVEAAEVEKQFKRQLLKGEFHDRTLNG
jgi:hypothetical protein